MCTCAEVPFFVCQDAKQGCSPVGFIEDRSSPTAVSDPGRWIWRGAPWGRRSSPHLLHWRASGTFPGRRTPAIHPSCWRNKFVSFTHTLLHTLFIHFLLTSHRYYCQSIHCTANVWWHKVYNNKRLRHSTGHDHTYASGFSPWHCVNLMTAHIYSLYDNNKTKCNTIVHMFNWTPCKTKCTHICVHFWIWKVIFLI